jgi:hypothetical protein
MRVVEASIAREPGCCGNEIRLEPPTDLGVQRAADLQAPHRGDDLAVKPKVGTDECFRGGAGAARRSFRCEERQVPDPGRRPAGASLTLRAARTGIRSSMAALTAASSNGVASRTANTAARESDLDGATNVPTP